jgi:hypothetical protein
VWRDRVGKTKINKLLAFFICRGGHLKASPEPKHKVKMRQGPILRDVGLRPVSMSISCPSF